MKEHPYVAARPPRILSLCSGIGGLDLGVHAALRGHCRTVCMVEREGFAAAVLAQRMRDGWLDDAAVWSDISSFDPQPWRGIVDGVVGSYPCQSLSNAGKRKGTADERWLWPHFARVIRDADPTWCFFENVAQHVNVGLDIVWEDLRQMGFDVEAGLFEAAEVGACHIRRRLFILAWRQEYTRRDLFEPRLLADAAGHQCQGGRALQPAPLDAASADGGQDVPDADGDGVRPQPGGRKSRRAGQNEPGDHGAPGHVADPQRRAEQPAPGQLAADGGGVRAARGTQAAAPERGGEDVAHPAGPRRPQGQPQSGKEVGHQAWVQQSQRLGRQVAAPRGAADTDVADALGGGGRRRVGGTGAGKTPGASRGEGVQAAGAAAAGGENVADAGGQRGGEGKLPAWRWVADADWRGRWRSSAGICRVAYGISARVGKLRALGNAVVPACAAYAFTALATRPQGQQGPPCA